MPSIKYFIEPLFNIEMFKIKCIDFKNKKKQMKKILKKFPEKRFDNFYSNRDKASICYDLNEIFNDEFNLIRTKYNKKIKLERAWSVTYKKGDYHIVHNHGSKGYCGIIYLDMDIKSPVTSYVQPFNDEFDRSAFFKPQVEEGDIVIVPQFILHYTEPNKINFEKKILSFDFL